MALYICLRVEPDEPVILQKACLVTIPLMSDKAIGLIHGRQGGMFTWGHVQSKLLVLFRRLDVLFVRGKQRSGPDKTHLGTPKDDTDLSISPCSCMRRAP